VRCASPPEEGLLHSRCATTARRAAQAFEAADAYGVMGMRERALHFGGTMEIHSGPAGAAWFWPLIRAERFP
jgi:signal transduction histidine kinase